MPHMCYPPLDMGVTNVKLTVKNPANPTKEKKGDFLVDTGAHYTVVPSAWVKQLQLVPSFTQEFSLADGRIMKRRVGSAVIKLQGKELAVPVVLGERGDSALLGVTTLESFGMMIDPFKRQLYHSRLMLA